jgi:CBS domain-containing protein
LLIVDENRELAGIITRGDILRALEENSSSDLTVLDAGSRDLVVAFPDEILYDAAAKMLRHNVGRLPVVSRQNPRRIVGYLGRSGFMAGHLRRFEEEHVRERRRSRKRSKAPAAVTP